MSTRSFADQLCINIRRYRDHHRSTSMRSNDLEITLRCERQIKCVRKALGQDIIPDVPKFDGYLPLNCGGLRPGREKRDRQYQKNV
jgi:hypothetical protein